MLRMGPKDRRVRKIEVSNDSVPEFELGDTAADIQCRGQEREAREREEEAQKQREVARREEGVSYTFARGGIGRKAFKEGQK